MFRHCMLIAAVLLLAGCGSNPIIPDTERVKPPAVDGWVFDQHSPAVPLSPAVPPAPLPSMTMEMLTAPPHTATIYTAEDVHGKGWCSPCNAKKKAWGDGNALIKIIWSPKEPPPGGPERYPAIRWKDSKGVERYPVNGKGEYYVPDTLEELINIIRESNAKPAKGSREFMQVEARSAPHAVAGGIRGREHIVMAQQWLRDHVGEGVVMTGAWDRTGAQTFPLLSNQNFSTFAMFGKMGRFRFEAPGGKLPVPYASLGYETLASDEFKLIGETRFKIPAGWLKDGQMATTASGQPVGVVDPATLSLLFTAGKAIWGLLHPQADLQLGGNVSAQAVLKGDVLTIDFQQMPRIRFVMLFTFNLAVRQVVVTPEKVTFFFDGSWFIKSRTFKVVPALPAAPAATPDMKSIPAPSEEPIDYNDVTLTLAA